jgi:hypothetical protein
MLHDWLAGLAIAFAIVVAVCAARPAAATPDHGRAKPVARTPLWVSNVP